MVFLVGLLGFGGWMIWAKTTERVVTEWLNARTNEGWYVNYDSVEVTGFPTEFRTELASLELADPETGWLWTLPVMTLEAQALRPDRIRAIWPEEQTLASPSERLSINAAAITSDLDVQPTEQFALDASDTILRDVQIQSDAGWRMVLPEGQISMIRQVDEPSTYDITFAARDLAPPAPMRTSLDPAGVLPDTLETLDYRATMAFDRPWDLRAIEDRRPQITSLDLDEANAVWGGLILRATGQIDVDASGVPDGALAVRAENWREMVAMAVRAGVLPESVAGTAEGILGVVAGLSGNPEVIDADLQFSNGRMFLGPLPIGPAPRLTLR